jgi:FdhD protein
MSISKYKGLKVQPNLVTEVEDSLTVEEALIIHINGTQFMVTMRTPGDEKELIRGLLFSEDIFRNQKLELEIQITKKSELGYISDVNVIIPNDQLGKGYKNSRSLLSVSSCGICGKPELLEISAKNKITHHQLKLDVTDINIMFDVMQKSQLQFAQSGGIHAAAIFDENKKLLVVKEDIGRHNAVDKAIGALLIDHKLKQAKYILASGRISYEILTKTFAARIPVIAAVSAPSSLAVDYAKELGITLLGFCRKNKFTAYSNVDRIIDINE